MRKVIGFTVFMIMMVAALAIDHVAYHTVSLRVGLSLDALAIALIILALNMGRLAYFRPFVHGPVRA